MKQDMFNRLTALFLLFALTICPVVLASCNQQPEATDNGSSSEATDDSSESASSSDTTAEGEFAKFREATKTPNEKFNNQTIYRNDDSTFSVNLNNSTYEDYLAIRNEIKVGVSKENIYEYMIGDNIYFYVQLEKGYEGVYYIPSIDRIKMLKHNTGKLLPSSLTEEKTFGEEKTLIQLCPDDSADNYGMGYMLALGDGHFIIYDGNGDKGNMADKIYKYLVDYTPKGQKPVIDAWIITHGHWDHVGAMSSFANKYASSVTVKNILGSFPRYSDYLESDNEGMLDFYTTTWPKIKSAFSGAKVWTPHTGQHFFVGDVKIEILYTHEDYSTGNIHVNDSSTVTMLHVNDKKIFFSADVEYETACQLLADMYGSYLKCDYYQVAHHGWNSRALLFYDYVDAPNILWPVRYRYWDDIQQFAATRRLTEELNSGEKTFYLTIDEDSIIKL